MSLKLNITEAIYKEIKLTAKQEGKYRKNKLELTDWDIYTRASEAANECLSGIYDAIRNHDDF